jgi:uncharacterized protein
MEIFVYILSSIFAITGVALTLFSLPGVWLVYIGILILALMGEFTIITPLILTILFILSLLSTFVDNIVIALGAKKLGGSKYGIIGAILGVFFGALIANIPGMFVGSFLGATLGEYIFAKKDLKKSFKAGLGSFLGVITSIVLKVGFCIGMIVYTLTLIF